MKLDKNGYGGCATDANLSMSGEYCAVENGV